MFSEILKDLRLKKGKKFTQEKFALELNVDRSTVAKWETGTIPPPEMLGIIADYFNVTIDFLLGREIPDKEKELNEYLEELKNRPEMKMLFKLAKGATKEDVEQAVKIIEALKK